MTSATLPDTASLPFNSAGIGLRPAAPLDSLRETLHRTGHFKHLMSAIKATGLASPFQAAGPYTVFAPNDQAFGKLPANLLSDLFKADGKARLTAILRLHLVPRRVLAPFSGGGPSTLKSLQGEGLVMHTAQDLRVNNARIVECDIEACNGLIHVIDTVLMPAAG